jgi:outer membrane receptor protein involved in Fe transport
MNQNLQGADLVRRRHLLRASAAFAALGALGLAAAHAETPTVGEVVVVATPLDAAGLALSRTPANAQTVDGAQIARQNPTSLADLLDRNLGSVSVSDGTGNPYQNDVNYRGFQATSLLGAPVGLAV